MNAQNGASALHYACHSGHVEAVNALAALGGDVNGVTKVIACGWCRACGALNATPTKGGGGSWFGSLQLDNKTGCCLLRSVPNLWRCRGNREVGDMTQQRVCVLLFVHVDVIVLNLSL